MIFEHILHINLGSIKHLASRSFTISKNSKLQPYFTLVATLRQNSVIHKRDLIMNMQNVNVGYVLLLSYFADILVWHMNSYSWSEAVSIFKYTYLLRFSWFPSTCHRSCHFMQSYVVLLTSKIEKERKRNGININCIPTLRTWLF